MRRAGAMVKEPHVSLGELARIMVGDQLIVVGANGCITRRAQLLGVQVTAMDYEVAPCCGFAPRDYTRDEVPGLG